MRNKLKLEAPLAVQARPEHAGFFPLNKFSAVPLLIKAARVAFSDAPGDDVRKRLMVVPRCHVSRLTVIWRCRARMESRSWRIFVIASPSCQSS